MAEIEARAEKENEFHPFCKDLKFDDKLLLSNEDFGDQIEALNEEEEILSKGKLENIAKFPSPYVLAKFASIVYNDHEEKKSSSTSNPPISQVNGSVELPMHNKEQSNPSEETKNQQDEQSNQIDGLKNQSEDVPTVTVVQQNNLEKNLDLPPGWKILTTATNKDTSNGYFGVAYWHPLHHHLVIAHRGTEVSNVGALYSDLMGICKKKYVPQMRSAITFAYRVLVAIRQKRKYDFHVFFTGHSLGGWLAQITNFSTKYLEPEKIKDNKSPSWIRKIFPVSKTPKERELFLMSGESFHPHTIAFDSPGCREMLLKIKDSFFVRTSSLGFEDLDITSYLSAPNRINTCNRHVGNLYRIFFTKEDMEMSWYDKKTFTYNMFTHSMEKILAAFKSEAKFLEIVDWPISGIIHNDEFTNFFKEVGYSEEYHLKVKTAEKQRFMELRYQTRGYISSECSLRVFTQKEQLFLKCYFQFRDLNIQKILRTNTMPDGMPEYVLEKLGKYKIDENKETKTTQVPKLKETNAEDLANLIPYVKKLMQLAPDLEDAIINDTALIRHQYENEKERTLQEEKSNLEFVENAEKEYFEKFFNDNNQQILLLQVKNGSNWNKLIMTYKLSEKFSTLYDKTVLKMEKLEEIDENFKFHHFLRAIDKRNLLIFSCGEELIAEEIKIIIEAFNKLKTDEKQKYEQIKTLAKIILITEKASETKIAEDLKNCVDQSLNVMEATINWKDLTNESQNKLLEGEIINFQGFETKLQDLMNLDCSREMDVELCDGILSHRSLEINSKPITYSDIRQIYEIEHGDKVISKNNLIDSLSDECVLIFGGIEAKTAEETQVLLADILELNSDVTKTNFMSALKTFKDEIDITEEDKAVLLLKSNADDDFEKKFDKLCASIFSNPLKYPWFDKKIIHFVMVEQEQDYCLFKNEKTVNFSLNIEQELKFSCKVSLSRLEAEEKISKLKANAVFIFETEPGFFGIESETDVSGSDNNGSEAGFLVIESGDIVGESGMSAKYPLEERDKIKELFNSENFQSAHWFKDSTKIRNGLVWYRSRGSLQFLHNLIDKKINNAQASSCHDNIEGKFDAEQKILTLVDETGTGKSTYLTSLVRSVLKTNWVITVNLKEIENKLKDRDLTPDSVSTLLLSKQSCAEEKFLLSHNLKWKTSKPLLILLDGFNDTQDKQWVSEFITFLKDKTPSSLIVTGTTDADRTIFKELLHPLPNNFCTFDLSKKKNFLRQFWRTEFSLQTSSTDLNKIFSNDETSKFETFTRQLLTKFESSLGEKGLSFMGMPLQMRMLSTVFLENFKKYCFNDKNVLAVSEFDTNRLYQGFIEAKYDTYLKKCRANKLDVQSKRKLKESYTNSYQHYALDIFPSEKTNNLWRNKFDDAGFDKKTLCKIGVVFPNSSNTEKYEFFHSSIRDFFIAGYFLKAFTKSSLWTHSLTDALYKVFITESYLSEFLLDELFVDFKYKSVRKFLNSFFLVHTEGNGNLAFKDFKPHFAYRVQCDESYLTTAAEEDNDGILKLSLLSLDNDEKRLRYIIKNKCLLHTAACYGSVKFASQFLSFYIQKENFKDEVEDSLLQFGNKGTVLTIAACKNQFEFIKWLLPFVDEKVPGGKIILSKLVEISFCSEPSHRILHRAVSHGSVETMKLLIQHGAISWIGCFEFKNLVLEVQRKGYREIENLLLENEKKSESECHNFIRNIAN